MEQTTSILQSEKLAEMLEYLEVLFSNTSENSLLLDRQGKILLFNKSYERFLQAAMGRNPVIGDSIFDIVPTAAELTRSLFRKALAGEVITHEQMFTVAAAHVTHKLIYTPIHVNGVVKYITVTGLDVTVERASDTLHKVSEANLKVIFDNTAEIFVLTDKDFLIKSFNAAFVNVWLKENINFLPNVGNDITPDEIVGRSLFDFFPNSPTPIENGSVVSYSRKIVTNNDPKWFDITIRKIEMPQGNCGYCLSMLDQTDTYRAKELREESEQRFRALVENSRDVFIIVDNTLTCRYVSPNVESVLGYAPSEMIGTRTVSFMHPSDAAQAGKDAETSSGLAEGTARNIFRRALHKDGGYRYLEGMAIELFNTPGVWGRLLIIRDVTQRVERDQQVQSLNKSLSDFQQAINGASIVSRTDRYGRITFVNENFIRVSGYSREELVGQTHKVVNSDYHSAAFWSDMWTTISRGQIWRREVKNMAKDGSYFWVDTFIAPFVDDEGKVTEFLSIRSDITERKMVEEVTRSYNERFELASKATNEAIWDWDIESNLEVWNHGLSTIFGYNIQTIINPRQWWKGKIHPDDYEGFETAVDDCFREKKEQWQASYRYLCSDGKYKYVLDRAYVVYRNGIPARMIGAMQDVTTQKQSLDEIKKLSLVASQTSNAVVITDGANKIEWVNSAFGRLTEYALGDVSGMDPAELFVGPETNVATIKSVYESITKFEPVTEEVLGYTKSGRKVWLHLGITPILDEEAKPRHFIYLLSDITEQKNYEAELLQYRTDLESLVDKRTRELNEALKKEKEIVEMKSRFVSIASHEFRMPLTAISMARSTIKKFGERMSRQEINDKLDLIDNQVKHMTSLLDDVLIMGKADAGRIEVNRQQVDLKNFIESVVKEIVVSTHHTHTIKMHLDISPALVNVDEKLLRNIFINLLTNAIKFSPGKSEVELKVLCNRQRVKISVSDTGIGIPVKEINTVFESFQRGSNANQIEGTGLGLAIVKKAVDLLKGKISVNSKEGQGTTFAIEFPNIK